MDVNKPINDLDGQEDSKATEETSVSLENSERRPKGESKSVIQGDRLKAIEDIRKKFKSQHLNSVKGALRRATNFNLDEKTDQFRGNHNVKFQEKYTVHEVIGQGSSAIVKRISEKSSNEIFAAKIVKIRDQESLNFLRAEYEILLRLEHKNIIKAKEFLVDDETGTAFLILEYAQGKCLQQLITEQTRIQEDIMRTIIEQLVSAIKYIHEKGICHRDIVPSNIIINNETNDVKLIDFSVSKIFKKELWSPSIEKSSTRKKSSPLLPHYPGLMLTDTGIIQIFWGKIIFGKELQHTRLQKLLLAFLIIRV